MELWRVLRAFEESVANPVLRRVLRSRVHWPFSRWFCLLSYEDRDYDERYSTPVTYTRTGDVVHVVTIRERSDWWKNFRDPYGCTLYVGGEPRQAVGEMVSNAVKHRNHVADFLHPVPALTGPGGEGSIDDVDFTNYVLVEFLLEPDTPAAREHATREGTTDGASDGAVDGSGTDDGAARADETVPPDSGPPE